jgi:G3E family GTPase
MKGGRCKMLPNIDLISGFLGAGKTTLINKILEDIVHLERVVLIENEFGEVGIDGKLLQKHGIEIREFNSGCICCTLFGDFVMAMRELISKYQPERIIVEPTGVGKLSDVLKACGNVNKVERIKINMLIAVVDCLKYEMYSYMFGDFFKDQIQTAKTVFLSRTQLADKGVVAKVREGILQLNKDVNIVTVPWDQLTGAEIIQIGEYDNLEEIDKLFADNHKDHVHDENENIQVWNKSFSTKYSKDQFYEKMNQLNEKSVYGMVLRGKGFFPTIEGNWLQFDYTPNEININSIDAQDIGKIIIIGKDINKSALDKLW